MQPGTPATPRFLYPVLSLLIVTGYWLPRLFRGFWIDETGAYWVAHDGWAQVWSKLQIYPGQSIVYAYLASFFAFGGPYKEALLRLPSVAGMLLAAWLLHLLAEDLAGPGTGWLAVVPFLCAGAMVETATNARPYALGLAIILASFFALRRWVQTGANRWLLGYVGAASLVVYFHYLFAVIFLVQVIYLLAAYSWGQRFSVTRIMAAGAFIGVAALPLVWQFLAIAQQSSRWKSGARPTAAVFLSFYPVHGLIAIAVGLLLFRFLHPEWFGTQRWLSSQDTVLLVTWVLLGPLLVFTAVRISGYALFATRYLIYALPPCFLLLAWCVAQVQNKTAQAALMFAVALSAALYVPQMHDRDWRGALTLAHVIGGDGTPILLRSGFVESASLNWQSEPKPGSYLFAPLSAYPVRNEIIPVPFFIDEPAARWLEGAIDLKAPLEQRFALVADNGSDALDILPAYLDKLGYRSSTREVDGITIEVFERKLR